MTGRSIESAATYINNTLVAKGYLEQNDKIEFPSLAQENETNHEKVANDTRIINVIYGLLDSMNHDDESNDVQFQKMRQLEQENEREVQAKKKALKQVKALKDSIARLEQMNRSLEASLNLANINHSNTKDAYSRLKSMATQQKALFANDLRRRDVELAAIRRKLREPKEQRKHSGIIGRISKHSDSYKVTEEEESANEKASDSTTFNDEMISINNELTRENQFLSKSLFEIRSSLAEYENIPNRGFEEIDLLGYSVDIAGIAQRIAYDDNITQEIKTGISQLYQAISDPSYVPVDEIFAKDKQIEQLRTELDEATTNWKKALQTMEEWKKYRASRGTGRSTRLSTVAKKKST